jgi:hypothetical protein
MKIEAIKNLTLGHLEIQLLQCAREILCAYEVMIFMSSKMGQKSSTAFITKQCAYYRWTNMLVSGEGQSWAPAIKISSDIRVHQYLTHDDQQLISMNDGRHLQTTTDAQALYTRQSAMIDSRNH